MARKSDGPWWNADKGKWYVWFGGRKVSLRTADEQEATKAWHRLMADGLPEKPKPPPEERLTVKRLADVFLADAVHRLKPPTLRHYRDYLAAFQKQFGNADADSVTPQQVSRWVHGLTHLGQTTKGIYLRSVGAMFGWAVANDMLPTNPVAKVPKPKAKSRSHSAVITDEQHALLLSVATEKQAAVLKVLHATGCRPGEACRITAASLDEAAGVVRLEEHKADATGKPRLLFLTPEVSALLSALASERPHGALLRTRVGNPWDAQSVNAMVRKLGLKVGLKVMPYGYRHGFCTAALAKGVPDAHVAALMGHTSTAMIHRHYSHLTQQASVLRESLARVRG